MPFPEKQPKIEPKIIENNFETIGKKLIIYNNNNNIQSFQIIFEIIFQNYSKQLWLNTKTGIIGEEF